MRHWCSSGGGSFRGLTGQAMGLTRQAVGLTWAGWGPWWSRWWPCGYVEPGAEEALRRCKRLATPTWMLLHSAENQSRTAALLQLLGSGVARTFLQTKERRCCHRVAPCIKPV